MYFNKKFLAVFVFLALVLSVSWAQANGFFVFNNNLKPGITHPDVKELQKFYNTNGFPLASFGPGSSGQESNFFGAKTKGATISFQKSNSLIPDGIVGPLTRAAINQKLSIVKNAVTGYATIPFIGRVRNGGGNNYVPPAPLVAIATPAIAGVTAPVPGATPTSTIADTTEYTATISWSGDPATFAGATAYTATITITPKSGYTLTGVPANFFTVAGATASNAENAGVVSALFPTTDTIIDIAAITGVVVPMTAYEPVLTVDETDEYTASVAWTPSIDPYPTFRDQVIYTGTITIVPKTGYTLSGVPANFFTVEGVAQTAGIDTLTLLSYGSGYTAAPVVEISAPEIGSDVATATATWDSETGAITSITLVNPGSGYIDTPTVTIWDGEIGVSASDPASVEVALLSGSADAVSNPANSGVVTAVFPKTPTIK